MSTTTRHVCAHPDCTRMIPANQLACGSHWVRLPRRLRQAIWNTYRPGQEQDGQPSAEYMAALDDVMRFWGKGKGGAE